VIARAALRERLLAMVPDRPLRWDQRVLIVLLVLGVALRLVFMLAYRPGLVGYPDTYIYLTDAEQNLFYDPLRAVGYPALLRALHAVNDSLSFATLVQHVLGIASALLVYAAVRRVDERRWTALIPAAVVLLGGDQIHLEHAILSESVYTFLLAAALFACTRAPAGGIGWMVAAAALVALSATVRLAGLALVPLVLIASVILCGPRWRRRLIGAGAAGAAMAAILGLYLVAAHDATGRWSFARNGAYSFYGRVATFADCSRFDEPRGTEALCEDTDPRRRNGAQWYVFSGPVVQEFGEPQVETLPEHRARLLARFSRSAALAQPFDWLDTTTWELVRYVAPDAHRRPADAPSTADYDEWLTDSERSRNSVMAVADYYSTGGIHIDRSLFQVMRDYKAAARVEGAPMGILVVLALVAPFVTRGSARGGAIGFGVAAAVLLVAPVALHAYDGRLGVPAYGPLAAAAAIGAGGVLDRVRRRAGGEQASSRATAT
jgi:hypothetical protein